MKIPIDLNFSYAEYVNHLALKYKVVDNKGNKFSTCDFPFFVSCIIPFSITPLCKNIRINDTKSPSLTALLIIPIRLS